jgi:hypothetical protein
MAFWFVPWTKVISMGLLGLVVGKGVTLNDRGFLTNYVCVLLMKWIKVQIRTSRRPKTDVFSGESR